jgi:hypothetical protein
LNRSIKPPGGENGRDGEASTFLAEGGADNLEHLADKFMAVGFNRIDKPLLFKEENYKQKILLYSIVRII